MFHLRYITVFALLIGFSPLPSDAAAPASYRLKAEIGSIKLKGGSAFGQEILISRRGTVIYRVTKKNGSTSMFAGSIRKDRSRRIAPLEGFNSIELTGMNAAGFAVGKSVQSKKNAYREQATTWTRRGGARSAAGLDPGSSSLRAVNDRGVAAGSSYDNASFGNRVVRWRDRRGGSLVELVPVPTGFDYIDALGISGRGDVLAFAVAGGLGSAAVWNGSSTTPVGPSPSAKRTIWPANLKINARGDIGILTFLPERSRYELFFVAAKSRPKSRKFSSQLAIDSAYGLQINKRGQMVFETSAGTVEFIDGRSGLTRSFSGYRPFINDQGEVVFGSGGKILYWNAKSARVAPIEVPVVGPKNARPPTPAGLDSRGNLLAIYRSESGTRDTLASFVPIKESR